MHMPHLKQRKFRPERMDAPELDRMEHYRALRGLRRLNQASGVAGQLWGQIMHLSRIGPGGTWRLLDVASGGGDVALELWRRAQRRGIRLQILGVDQSLAACEYAAKRCREAGDAISFRPLDVTSQPLPAGFDVVTCSLFLHHLSSAQAPRLLAAMAAAGQLLVASDLRRSIAGYALAQLACRTLTRSPIVRFDGPQSVANAFSVREMRELCRTAGLLRAVVRACWPCRLMVIHQRSS